MGWGLLLATLGLPSQCKVVGFDTFKGTQVFLNTTKLIKDTIESMESIKQKLMMIY